MYTLSSFAQCITFATSYHFSRVGMIIPNMESIKVDSMINIGINTIMDEYP